MLYYKITYESKINIGKKKSQIKQMLKYFKDSISQA